MVVTGKIQTNQGVKTVSYLEESEYNWFLSTVKGLDTRIGYLNDEINHIYNLLGELLSKEILEQAKGKIKMLIPTLTFGRSFRYSDINRLIPGPWRLEHFRSQAFEEIVKEGLLEARGSGWYRRPEG